MLSRHQSAPGDVKDVRKGNSRGNAAAAQERTAVATSGHCAPHTTPSTWRNRWQVQDSVGHDTSVLRYKRAGNIHIHSRVRMLSDRRETHANMQQIMEFESDIVLQLQVANPLFQRTFPTLGGREIGPP